MRKVAVSIVNKSSRFKQKQTSRYKYKLLDVILFCDVIGRRQSKT